MRWQPRQRLAWTSKTHVLALLGRDGVIEKSGENKIYDSVYSAVEDHIPQATES